MNFSEEQIQLSEALADMSQGLWEGSSMSEIYTPEILGLMDRFQPDFAAPSGESLREVEFRIIQFLNRTVLGLPEKLQSDHPSHQNAHSLSNSIRHRLNFNKKKSGKSRLQFVTYTGDHQDMEDDNSPREASISSYDLNGRSSDSAVSSSVGIFTHSLPIKCVITGLLGCSPVMASKICIDDSSVTVLQHSWMTGWQIKRLNDTAHLRLL